ncbi:MAG: hypothetical protein IT360_09440 [Gemmatimonadaceae bacterium]|nr:hypothetical protein [Gemmatimonadaceae bacterium]
MMRTFRVASLAALLLSTGACADFLTSSNEASADSQALTAAFSTVPVGFANNSSSYSGESDGVTSLWLPGRHARGFGREGLMGGGLGDAFAGAMSAGRGFGHHGPFGGRFGGGRTCDGAFDASTGWFVCAPAVRNGVTATQQVQYKAAAGAVQAAFDTATTNSVQVQSSAAGTVSYVKDSTHGPSWGGRKGPPHIGRLIGDSNTVLTANTTVSHRSDRLVTGLATGSTRRTVAGTSAGDESTTGTTSAGTFTARRVAADTTRGVVIPIADGKPTYPVEGTVIRVMNASFTVTGASPVTASRREVITYDGSSTATIVITINGDTKTCTMALPKGRPVCP